MRPMFWVEKLWLFLERVWRMKVLDDLVMPVTYSSFSFLPHSGILRVINVHSSIVLEFSNSEFLESLSKQLIFSSSIRPTVHWLLWWIPLHWVHCISLKEILNCQILLLSCLILLFRNQRQIELLRIRLIKLFLTHHWTLVLVILSI
jgi:hypothetical protein